MHHVHYSVVSMVPPLPAPASPSQLAPTIFPFNCVQVLRICIFLVNKEGIFWVHRKLPHLCPLDYYALHYG